MNAINLHNRHSEARQVVHRLEKELANYEGGKGTIRFPLNKPLPLPLIRKIVKARMLENAEKEEAKKKLS